MTDVIHHVHLKEAVCVSFKLQHVALQTAFNFW